MTYLVVDLDASVCYNLNMETKIYPISYVLRLAADKYLEHPSKDGPYLEMYSCSAISNALDYLYEDNYEIKWEQEYRIIEGLENMGLDTDGLNFTEYMTSSNPTSQWRRCVMWKPSATSQEMRHAWLYFAAMIAEEQGD